MTEDEVVGWHDQLDGHEFEQAPGVGDGQRNLAACSPWGRKESDTTEQLDGTDLTINSLIKNINYDNALFKNHLCEDWKRKLKKPSRK